MIWLLIGTLGGLIAIACLVWLLNGYASGEIWKEEDNGEFRDEL